MIVVTGGAGFIGSALIWGLNKNSYNDILVVDALGSDERWKNLVNLQFYDFVHKADFIVRLERGDFGHAIDGIIHMGACSSTTEKNADFLLENNYEYSKRLAKWCIQRQRRFVYASSAATYGDGTRGFSDEHAGLADLKPLNMYGYSKQLMDLWAFNKGHLKTIAGLKYFNVFGANEYHKEDMRSVVHKAFEQILNGGSVRLFKSYQTEYKDGWQLRDFLYIKDAVAMTLFVYEHGDINGIFNIGTGTARSFYDLVAAVFNALGKEISIDYIKMPESIRDKYQYYTCAEMDKLRRTGFDKPLFSLEEGISDYVKNYLLSSDLYLG